MAQILDYSAGYPGAVNIARLGYAGGIRYLRKEGSSGVRPLTPAEVLDYQSRALELAVVYQHVRKSRVLEGRAAGRHDAAWALAQASDCGIEPRCIYFAVDFDTISAQQWAAVREYMLGAGEILGPGRVGTYGEYDLLDYLFTRGSIAWGWQTYAWSVGHNKDNQPRHPRAHLFQRLGLVNIGGIDCDVNDVLHTDYGQTPAPTNPEDDMPYTEKQIREMVYGAMTDLANDAVAAGERPDDPNLRTALAFRNSIRSVLAGVPASIDDATAAKIADRLAEHGAAGITPEQVKAALTDVLDTLILTARTGA